MNVKRRKRVKVVLGQLEMLIATLTQVSVWLRAEFDKTDLKLRMQPGYNANVLRGRDRKSTRLNSSHA